MPGHAPRTSTRARRHPRYSGLRLGADGLSEGRAARWAGRGRRPPREQQSDSGAHGSGGDVRGGRRGGGAGSAARASARRAARRRRRRPAVGARRRASSTCGGPRRHTQRAPASCSVARCSMRAPPHSGGARPRSRSTWLPRLVRACQNAHHERCTGKRGQDRQSCEKGQSEVVLIESVHGSGDPRRFRALTRAK